MKPEDLTPESVAEIRSDFMRFVEYMFQARTGAPFKRNWHQDKIADALERVVIGDTTRLIINVPPRSGKTELVVVMFIAWCMGNWPDSEFITTSYSKRLAANNTYNVRDIMRHEAYSAIFPASEIKHDSGAKDEFKTAQGGVVYATGAEGTITGYGAGKMRAAFGGAILIDDPHKPTEAQSDVTRENVLDWYQTTLESRVNRPETPIILIMQRLHEGDLAGWLLAGNNGEEWEHLCIPAEDDKGESFWAEQFPKERLRRLALSAPYQYAGQYLQQPAPLEGGIFKPHKIETVDAIPVGTRKMVRGWDMASLAGDGDFTSGAKLGTLPDGRVIILDMQREQLGPDERDALMVNTAKRDGKKCRISIPQDPGQAGKTQVAYLTREFKGFRIESTPETGDKITRAEPFAAQVNVGNVVMLRGDWNEALIREMKLFPNAVYDDQIDSLSRAYSLLIGRRSGLKINANTVRRTGL